MTKENKLSSNSEEPSNLFEDLRGTPPLEKPFAETHKENMNIILSIPKEDVVEGIVD